MHIHTYEYIPITDILVAHEIDEITRPHSPDAWHTICGLPTWSHDRAGGPLRIGVLPRERD